MDSKKKLLKKLGNDNPDYHTSLDRYHEAHSIQIDLKKMRKLLNVGKSAAPKLNTDHLDQVEEKFPQGKFLVLSRMRILGKIGVAIFDVCRVCRNFTEIWCEIGF